MKNNKSYIEPRTEYVFPDLKLLQTPPQQLGPTSPGAHGL